MIIKTKFNIGDKVYSAFHLTEEPLEISKMKIDAYAVLVIVNCYFKKERHYCGEQAVFNTRDEAERYSKKSKASKRTILAKGKTNEK